MPSVYPKISPASAVETELSETMSNFVSSISYRDTLRHFMEENELLREEIRVSREAAEITANLVVRQFEETEKILRRFQIANQQRKAVLNSATQIAIISTDKSGIITIFNTGAENLLGYKAEEVVKKKTPEIFLESVLDTFGGTTTPEYVSRVSGAAEILFEYALQGSCEQLEWTFIRKDGRRFPVSMTLNALRNPDGDIGGMLCIASDISERKEAEAALKNAHNELERRVRERTAQLAKINKELETEIRERTLAEKALRHSEEKYRGFFENATEGIFQSTPEGRILTANPAMVRFLGYASEEDITQVRDVRSRFYVRPEDRDRYRKLLESKGHVREFETRYFRKNGDIIDVSINARAVRDEKGHLLCYEGMIQDITQRKRNEELKIAKETAEAATRAKSDFLANMSHEIRTPMNAIIGLTGLALKTDLSPRQQDYLSKINASAHSLLGLINDVLDFSKIEAGRLELENSPFHLRDVMDNLADIFSGRIAEKGIEMAIHTDADVPCALIGDSLRLSQVLINLTGNAVKFTENGEVIVRTSLLHRDEEKIRLRFEISDTGIGIDRDYLPRLFTSFSQADPSTTRKYGGTGLGLTICRELVRLMKGDIRAESEAGRGSTFYFTAEFRADTKREKPDSRPPEMLQGLNILLVDNNETSRNIYAEILHSFSCRVQTAENAADAIEMLREAAKENAFDMVLMDWRMPETDGITATKQIRAIPELSRLPVVLMTAFGRDEIMQKAEAAGANAFLIKPVKQSLLFDTIMDIFDHTGKEKGICAAAPKKIPDTSFLRGKKILLAEDNLINQQVASEILQDAGAVVDLADNGKIALEALGSKSYDAVLMDVQMPELDGYQTVHLIRKYSCWEKLPVIAMTAHAMKGDREKCLAAGMNDYISKPIENEQLFSVLSAHLSGDCKELSAITLPFSADSASSSEKENVCSQPAEKVSVPGIDTDAIFRRIRKKEVFFRLLKDFAKEHAETAQKIRTAVQEGKREEALRLIHNLKGVAGNLSAVHLHESALALENILHKNDKIRFPEAFSQLKNSLDTVLRSGSSLKAEKTDSTEKKGYTDKKRIQEQIQALAGYLRQNDLEAENCLNVLKKEMSGSRQQQEWEQLENRIRSLDFRTAYEILKNIAQGQNMLWGKKEE
jgi:PAS domain S-box-containing protein